MDGCDHIDEFAAIRDFAEFDESLVRDEDDAYTSTGSQSRSQYLPILSEDSQRDSVAFIDRSALRQPRSQWQWHVCVWRANAR